MNVTVMGYHNMGCIGIRALVKKNIPISAVFTHRDNSKENIWFVSVAELCKSLNLKVYYAEDFNKSQMIRIIKDLSPDLIFSFYYRHVIPSEILNIPKLGAINLHSSILPKYRGRCPVNWQLINGEKESGVTLHYMTETPDAGDIIAQRKVPVTEDDTALSLYKKLEKSTESLLDEKIEDVVSGRCRAIPQDEAQATVYKSRKPEDGRINWGMPSDRIYNLIRAVTKPYPGAFSFLKGEKIIIWKAKVFRGQLSSKPAQPGQIFKYRDRLYIKTGDGWLRVIELDCIQSNGQRGKDTVDATSLDGDRLN